MQGILPTTFQFLKDLSEHNDRVWFNEHKSTYLAAQQNMIDFVEQLMLLMGEHDLLESESGKKSLYRIYSDVRFSKDKSPYNPRFAFNMVRATKQRRGGYYVNIRPGNCFLACGFFAPNTADLKRFREDIATNSARWDAILRGPLIVHYFGELKGEQVPTVPRGYDKQQAGIEWIRHKQFILRHDFADHEVLAPDFLHSINEIFKAARPFLELCSEVLTTNANGESLD